MAISFILVRFVIPVSVILVVHCNKKIAVSIEVQQRSDLSHSHRRAIEPLDEVCILQLVCNAPLDLLPKTIGPTTQRVSQC